MDSGGFIFIILLNKHIVYNIMTIYLQGGQIMVLFGGNKEEKEAKEIAKFIQKYKFENIDSSDLAMIKEISNDLLGLGLMKAGLTLTFAKAEEQAKVGYLSALVKQNWMIIRKLDDISRKIKV